MIEIAHVVAEERLASPPQGKRDLELSAHRQQRGGAEDHQQQETLPRASLTRQKRALVTADVAVDYALAFEVNRALVHRDDLLPYFADLSRVDPGLFVQLLASAGEHDATPHLPHVRVPTLVLVGADGRIVGAVAGEGNRAVLDEAIGKALQEAKASVARALCGKTRAAGTPDSSASRTSASLADRNRLASSGLR